MAVHQRIAESILLSAEEVDYSFPKGISARSIIDPDITVDFVTDHPLKRSVRVEACKLEGRDQEPQTQRWGRAGAAGGPFGDFA